MKWLYATKINRAIIFFMLALLLIALAVHVTTGGTNIPSIGIVDGDYQFGCYDLMSQKNEIYNARMETTHSTIFATITSLNDRNFFFKGEFTPRLADDGKLHVNLTPIHYSTTRNGAMIDGLIDMLTHDNLWLEKQELKDQPLVVGQNGVIFLAN